MVPNPCFLLFSLSLFLVSAAGYQLPDRYFINCGSDSTVIVGPRSFVGDVNSNLFSGHTETAAQNSTQIYQTARYSAKQFSYALEIDQTGVYVVRFHFSPFSALGDLSVFNFTVYFSGVSVSPNLNVNSSNSPLTEEFLLTIRIGKLRIDFSPNGQNSKAFVNAIEVFLAPPNFIRDVPVPYVTPQGQFDKYNAPSTASFRIVHRINVGGEKITPDIDTWLRNWIPDEDDDMVLSNASVIAQRLGDRPSYMAGFATEDDAPDPVYATARQMNINADDSRMNNFNMSWRFRVKQRCKHLVRVHFCDIVTRSRNEFVRFYLYIYTNYSLEIWPFGEYPQPAVPFYMDFVVESDDSGFMNISIGPGSRDGTRSFLNGLEIMQLVENNGGHGSSKKHLFLIVGLVVGGVVLAIGVLAALLLVFKKKKWMNVEALDWDSVPQQGGSSYSRTTIGTVSGSPFADLHLGLKISFAEILYATNKFDPKSMIGEGGFGKVYKGMLGNGTKVAVKRSEPGHGQGLSEFQTEIVLLSKIRHQHLVSLIGYCDERDEMILVYEFMEKGTLRDHLYSDGKDARESVSRSELLWDERLRICIGAAKGLNYLHTGAAMPIIHRDIKSTNILLDENYVAKVADFGLSRSGPPDQTHVSTEVKGSFGYLDPEYFKCLQLTQKSDVYSFGVVLLEILCARPAVGLSLPRDQVNLADWGLSWQKLGQLETIADPLLKGKINPNSLRIFGETAEKCLQELGADRPSMVDVLWNLEYCLKLQHSGGGGEGYDDSMTSVAMGFPLHVLQRFPSESVGIDEDEDDRESDSCVDVSQVDGGDVFSQMKIDGAR